MQGAVLRCLIPTNRGGVHPLPTPKPRKDMSYRLEYESNGIRVSEDLLTKDANYFNAWAMAKALSRLKGTPVYIIDIEENEQICSVLDTNDYPEEKEDKRHDSKNG